MSTYREFHRRSIADREGFWAEQGGWAPEVHEYKGKFYLLTTLHNDKKELPQELPDRKSVV